MTCFQTKVEPDFQGMIDTLLRRKAPERVYHLELYLDEAIRMAVAERFELTRDLDENNPWYELRRDTRVHQFLGYDMMRILLPGFEFPLDGLKLGRQPNTDAEEALSERTWVEEHSGPIQSWEDFEKYPWPDVKNMDLRPMEWVEKNLPDGMAVHDLTTHIFEQLCFLMGYEALCYKIYDAPDLVEAVTEKVGQLYLEHTRVLCQFPRMGAIFGSDDMGFKSQPLLSPAMLKKLILPWHKKAAEIAHEYDKPYLLHACGSLDMLMDDLIDDVGIDAKHSFEDTIDPVTNVKKKYGDRVGLIGGIDMDFLCRASVEEIRKRTRETLDVCQPGGGYCLGTGNSVADYIPLDNYLAMMDEGRNY